MTCKYRLGSQQLARLLGRPETYKRLPAFLFLEDTGLSEYQRYREAVAKACCSKPDPSTIMVVSIPRFLQICRRLAEIRPDVLVELRAYVSELCQQPIDQLTIPWHDLEGKTDNLVF